MRKTSRQALVRVALVSLFLLGCVLVAVYIDLKEI